MTRIAELYGLPTSAPPSGTTWADVATRQPCPFLRGGKCLKTRKGNSKVTLGTCTVKPGKNGQQVVICPFRLLAGNQFLLDCQSLFQSEPGDTWHEVRELQIPGGHIDYCLVLVRKGTVVDFAGVEIQAVDTTGTAWPERQQFLSSHGVKATKRDLNSDAKVGLNWKMTAKTTLVQLLHKVNTFEHLSKKFVLVLQDRLMQYMQQEFTFQHLTNPPLPSDAMRFHVYGLRTHGNQPSLQLMQQYGTTTAGVEKCLHLQAEAKVELPVITNKIQEKICDKTRLRTDASEPTSSLIADAIEKEDSD
jgi:hypothetical protein